MSPSRKHLYSLLAIVVFLTSMVLLKSVNGSFFIDEFEHIHSTWYVKDGHVPYRDFFQHHNPLLWYLMAPLLWIFGETVEAMMACRILIFAVSLAIAFLVYSISRTLTMSREAGLISVVLLFSMPFFVDSTIEIRPDVPMLLFSLISIHFLVRYLQEKKAKFMAFSGLFASISFLFLQKTIFLLLAYAGILACRLIRRKLPAKDLLYFCLFFLLPQLVLLVCLLTVGAFHDYILTNWLTNAACNLGYKLSPFVMMDWSKQYRVFWGLSALAVLLILVNRKTTGELKAVAFIALVLFLTLFLVRSPWRYYFMPLIAVLSVVIGCFLKIAFDNLKLAGPPRMLLILLIIFIPTTYLVKKANIAREDIQFEKAGFVLANSKASDFVYDGYNTFNVYRPDLHYFWFSLGENRCFGTYNRITDNKYGDYDIYELIKLKKPRFISDFELDISEGGLDELYSKTRFDGLYMRKTAE